MVLCALQDIFFDEWGERIFSQAECFVAYVETTVSRVLSHF